MFLLKIYKFDIHTRNTTPVVNKIIKAVCGIKVKSITLSVLIRGSEAPEDHLSRACIADNNQLSPNLAHCLSLDLACRFRFRPKRA